MKWIAISLLIYGYLCSLFSLGEAADETLALPKSIMKGILKPLGKHELRTPMGQKRNKIYLLKRRKQKLPEGYDSPIYRASSYQEYFFKTSRLYAFLPRSVRRSIYNIFAYYGSKPEALPIDEFLLNRVGVSKSEVTRTFNNLAFMQKKWPMKIHFHLFESRVNTIVKAFVPEEMSPFLFISLVSLCVMLQSNNPPLPTNNIRRVLKRFLQFGTNTHLKISDFLTVEEGLLTTHSENLLQHYQYENLLRYNIIFYTFDLGPQLFKAGYFSEIRLFISRQITSHEFAQPKEGYLFLKICKSAYLSNLLSNQLLKSSEKVRLAIDVVNFMDPKLPIACYFRDWDYTPRESSYVHPDLQWYYDALEHFGVSQESKDKFHDFFANITMDTSSAFRYTLAKMYGEWKTKMRKALPKSPDQCPPYVFDREIRKAGKLSKEHPLCIRLRFCEDLTGEISNPKHGTRHLFDIAGDCGPSTISEKHIAFIVKNISQVDDPSSLIVSVLEFCATLLPDGTVHPACSVLGGLHNATHPFQQKYDSPVNPKAQEIDGNPKEPEKTTEDHIREEIEQKIMTDVNVLKSMGELKLINHWFKEILKYEKTKPTHSHMIMHLLVKALSILSANTTIIRATNKSVILHLVNNAHTLYSDVLKENSEFRRLLEAIMAIEHKMLFYKEIQNYLFSHMY